MGFFPQYGIRPRRTADGRYPVVCRTCHRIICYRLTGEIHSVEKCAICEGQPESAVLQQYAQLDPTMPPVPLNEAEPMFLYEEEEKAAAESKATGKPWPGLMKPLFKMLSRFGFQKDEASVPQSKKTANRKRGGGLFERE